MKIKKKSKYAPNFEKVGGHIGFGLFGVCVCVCFHVRDIVLKLHVWIPDEKIADAYFWLSLNYLPLLNYGPLTNKGMKFCKCRILKSIIARNLQLVMLIGDADLIEYLTKMKKNHMIFFELLPFFKILDPEILQLGYSAMRYVLKLHVWIPHGKIADVYFFLELSPLVKLRPFEKNEMNFVNAISQKVLKIET